MQDQYTAPELRFVDEAENVVLGGGAVGPDIFGEQFYSAMEFQTDEDLPPGQ